MTLSKRVCLALSIAAGIALEVIVSEAAGEEVAWNAGHYWLIALPAALVFSSAVGFFARDRSWKAAAVIAPAQLLTMTLRGGMVAELVLVWIILTAILSGLFLLAAWTGGKIRRVVAPPA